MLILVSGPIIADTYYGNGLPKVNEWKEYFFWCIPAMVAKFIDILFMSYNSRIVNHGLNGMIPGTSFQFIKYIIINIILLSIVTAILVVCLTIGGVDPLAGEFVYYLFIIPIILGTTLFYRGWVIKMNSPLIKRHHSINENTEREKLQENSETSAASTVTDNPKEGASLGEEPKDKNDVKAGSNDQGNVEVKKKGIYINKFEKVVCSYL